MGSCYRFFFFGYLIKYLYCGLLHVMYVVTAYNGEGFTWAAWPPAAAADDDYEGRIRGGKGGMRLF